MRSSKLGVGPAFDFAGQLHDSPVDSHIESFAVDPERSLGDVLANLAFQLLIGPDERADPVRAGHDSDEP